MIPDLTRAVGVPRLAGISYPMGQPLGRPHDADGQRAVLRATLELLESAPGPDSHVDLPFEWPESPAQARNASKGLAPAPIVELLKRRPWLVANLYSGRIPGT
jgi:D-proline reductase (dithiol) PrdB